jgi:hypothetical protein
MEKKDRLMLPVWIAFVPLAGLTAIFGPLLVLFSDSTRSFWAWEITPAMSAVWVGAGYTFGAMAIVTMLLVGRWRGAVVAIAATWPFSIVMLAATLLHLDRFFLGTLNFYVWLAIYVVLPVALPLIWWLNRKQDPGPQAGDTLVPASPARLLGGVGVALALASLLLIVTPPVAASFWPWRLTPLMSQVIGGWILFVGVGLVCLLFERRYIAYRYFLISASIWMAILFVASFLHLDNFDFSRAASWLWFVLVGGASVGALGFYFYMERLHRNTRVQSPAAAPGAAG